MPALPRQECDGAAPVTAAISGARGGTEYGSPASLSRPTRWRRKARQPMKTSIVTHAEVTCRRALRRAVACGYVHTMRNGTMAEHRPTGAQLGEAQRIVASEAGAALVQIPRTMLVELI